MTALPLFVFNASDLCTTSFAVQVIASAHIQENFLPAFFLTSPSATFDLSLSCAYHVGLHVASARVRRTRRVHRDLAAVATTFLPARDLHMQTDQDSRRKNCYHHDLDCAVGVVVGPTL